MAGRPRTAGDRAGAAGAGSVLGRDRGQRVQPQGRRRQDLRGARARLGRARPRRADPRRRPRPAGRRHDGPGRPRAPRRDSVADVITAPRRTALATAVAASGWTTDGGGRLDVLLGSPGRRGLDGPRVGERALSSASRTALSRPDDYRLVLIDCPPSFGALTRTGLVASHRALVVTEPALFSVTAADRALRAVDDLRRSSAPAPAAARRPGQPLPGPVPGAPVPADRAAVDVRPARARAVAARAQRAPAGPGREQPGAPVAGGRGVRDLRRVRHPPRPPPAGRIRAAGPPRRPPDGGAVSPRRASGGRTASSSDGGAIRRNVVVVASPGRSPGSVARLPSTSRQTRPTAMPNTPWPPWTRSMTSSAEVHS